MGRPGRLAITFSVRAERAGAPGWLSRRARSRLPRANGRAKSGRKAWFIFARYSGHGPRLPCGDRGLSVHRDSMAANHTRVIGPWNRLEQQLAEFEE